MKTLYTLSLFSALWIFNVRLAAQVTPQEAISQMTRGINLGNTHEPPLEAGWNNPKAEEYYFDMYKEAGFNTIRIPVRWDGYTERNSPYKIDDYWLNRIEEVVDWGLERDLWIIINAHHDDWIKDNYDQPALRARFDSIWSQVATHFKDKSEKLIFEILNEPYGMTKADCDDLHARAISLIRKTNPTRLIIFQGNNWGGSTDLMNAAIPADPYVIGSFHSYDPWPFGLEGTGSFGSAYDIQTLRNKFTSLKSWSERNNIPVFLGEFGCHSDADYISRVRHFQTYVELSREFGFCPCVWDDGGNFRVLQRQQHTWNYIKDILIYGDKYSPGYPGASILNDTIIRIRWENRVTDNDRIIIQRGLDPLNMTNFDTLSANNTEYLDIKPGENKTWYYRLIAEYEDSVSYYSYAARAFMPAYIPPEFVINVIVTDTTNAKRLSAADVQFNQSIASTSIDGLATFDEYEGSYLIQISKEFYTGISETVEIVSDTSLYYYLSATHGDIKIWVKEDGKALSNVSVIIAGEEIFTNTLGIAKFENLPLNTDYNFSLAKDGYHEFAASLFLRNDTTFTLEMMPLAIGKHTGFDDWQLWPNPAQSILSLSLPDTPGRIQITDLAGNIMKDLNTGSEDDHSIYIGDLTNGMYVVMFVSDFTSLTGKFIKSDK